MWGDDGDLNGGWPGIQMTWSHKNEFSQDVYKVNLIDKDGKVAKYIIFHNNSGTQTQNIKLEDYVNFNAMYYDNGNVGGYLYIPE